MDNLPTTRPGETPCARARELDSPYLTGNARGGIQETVVYRSEPILNDSRRKALPLPTEPLPPKPPDPPGLPPAPPLPRKLPADDCISVSTDVSERTDFSCETSSLFSFVPSADGVGTCPRYRFDDFMTDCLQEDSAFNSIHAGCRQWSGRSRSRCDRRYRGDWTTCGGWRNKNSGGGDETSVCGCDGGGQLLLVGDDMHGDNAER